MPEQNLDLDPIAAGATKPVTLFGKARQLKPISATSIRLLRSATDDTYIDIGLTIAKRSITDLTDDELDELTVPQLEAIIAVATGDVDAVSRLDPNYVAPSSDEKNGTGPVSPSGSPA